ncbi:helix-turn-helix domain-containing protein [Thauera sp. 63]|jgi:Ner family transcriptional regulator|uniref:helix-turn-helix domain-containing protein n=1 Tax=Thauera sp. 63 TaxID=497321 RepID=UPI0002CDDE99|nr:helix-turn-helix transcriptional regulator [Thauera sp. 63]ENO80298.1 Nlp family transcriptional regulator [Thauera sp. 63]
MARKAPKKASHTDWHKADIKAALEKAGWTLRALADHHGVSSTTLSHAFDRCYPVSEVRIANAIGVPVQEVWPSRWFPDGTPRPRSGRRSPLTGVQSTALLCQRNGNERTAA